MGSDGVVAVEWADRFDVLPRDCVAIRIEVSPKATPAPKVNSSIKKTIKPTRRRLRR